MEISPELLDKLKQRYDSLYPLIFYRSIQKAKTLSELFDLLESCPKALPIVWDDSENKWIHTNDLVLVSKFDLEKKME